MKAGQANAVDGMTRVDRIKGLGWFNTAVCNLQHIHRIQVVNLLMQLRLPSQGRWKKPYERSYSEDPVISCGAFAHLRHPACAAIWPT